MTALNRSYTRHDFLSVCQLYVVHFRDIWHWKISWPDV